MAGILVIISLLYCTPYLYHVPKSTLAAITIAAVIFTVEIRVVKPIYRSKKSDRIPGLGTFFACLFLRMELGILIGVGLNLISILYHAATPKLSIKINKVIEFLVIDFAQRQQLLFFYNLKPSLVTVFEGVRPKDFNFCVFYDSRDIDWLLQKHQPINNNSED
uniref:Sodium-independent sulfate anion transporter n=1 Tax=Sipha flava TaxID=143950 RepID=A0A2S2Q4D0_9HEMI